MTSRTDFEVSCRGETDWRKRDIWIGLRKCTNADSNCVDGYMWADGTQEMYRGWENDGPINSGSDECIRIRGNRAGFPWDIAPCGNAFK